MIRKLVKEDRQKIENILTDTNNFNNEEIRTAMELVDIYLKDPDQKDYEFYVDNEEENINGYVCIGPRPLTSGTYDLYWIAVNPNVQSRGIGSRLLDHSEKILKERSARLLLIETSGKPSYEKERRFYEKNKYEELVTIKDFYNVDDSLVIYGKYL